MTGRKYVLKAVDSGRYYRLPFGFSKTNINDAQMWSSIPEVLQHAAANPKWDWEGITIEAAAEVLKPTYVPVPL